MEYKCQEIYGSRFCVNCGDCFFESAEQNNNEEEQNNETASVLVQQV